MYIVLDLEYNQPFKINKITRNLEKPEVINGLRQEIIEIGAVKLDDNLNVYDSFRIYIKPKVYKRLHPKIKDITKITYDDLKVAFAFPEGISYFRRWIKEEDIIFCVWDKIDIVELKRNCEFYNLSTEWINYYINIQRVYSETFNLNEISLKKAILNLNINNENKFHSALEDANYTSKIMKLLNQNSFEEYVNDQNIEIKDKSYKWISDIKDKRIDKRYFVIRCPVCGRFSTRLFEWKTFGWSIRNIGYCKQCNNYISALLTLRNKQDGTIKYKGKQKIINKELYEEFKNRYEN